MHYVKHFDILGVDTVQIPCIELHGVPNAATEGAVGLLGMNVDSEGNEVYICTAVNGAVYTWKALKDGKDGVSVIGTYINTNGELIITLSNGQTLNAGMVKGTTGDPGKDGEDGVDGVSVVKVETNENYELLVTLSNGKTQNAGSVLPSRYEEFMASASATYVSKSTLPVTISDNIVFDTSASKDLPTFGGREAYDIIGVSSSSITIVQIDGNTSVANNTVYQGISGSAFVSFISTTTDVIDINIPISNEYLWGAIKVRIFTTTDTPKIKLMSGVIYQMDDTGQKVVKHTVTTAGCTSMYIYFK